MATFHPFPRLPLELRTMIWQMAVAPRDVKVSEQADHIQEGGSTFRSTRRYFKSPTPPPALLHACHESRSICTPFYTKAFTYGAQPRYTWVNYALDTIVVRDVEVALLSDEAPFIRYLTVYVEDTPYYPHTWDHFQPAFSLSMLLEFPALEQFVYLTSETVVRRWSRRLEVFERKLGEQRPGGPWPEVKIVIRHEPDVGREITLQNYRGFDRA